MRNQKLEYQAVTGLETTRTFPREAVGLTPSNKASRAPKTKYETLEVGRFITKPYPALSSNLALLGARGWSS